MSQSPENILFQTDRRTVAPIPSKFVWPRGLETRAKIGNWKVTKFINIWVKVVNNTDIYEWHLLIYLKCYGLFKQFLKANFQIFH